MPITFILLSWHIALTNIDKYIYIKYIYKISEMFRTFYQKSVIISLLKSMSSNLCFFSYLMDFCVINHLIVCTLVYLKGIGYSVAWRRLVSINAQVTTWPKCGQKLRHQVRTHLALSAVRPSLVEGKELVMSTAGWISDEIPLVCLA